MNWRSIRLKHHYRVIDQRAGSDQPPLLAVSIHHGVVPRDSLTDKLPRAEDLSNYKICAPGDIVLNRMRAFQGAIGIASMRGLVSPDYLVIRPNRGVDARYLHHLFRSSWFVGEMISRLRGIGGTESGSVRTPRINPEDLGDITVSLPELEEQRRIADFLDEETARIDNLVELRSRQRRVIHLRQRVHAEKALRECSSGEWTRVKYLLRVRPRYGVLVPVFEDEGIPFIRVNDLLDLPGRASELAKIPTTLSNQYARTITRPGDVLISVVGTLGRAAVVPGELAGANIARAVCSIRLRLDIDPNLFVAWTDTSDFERQALLATGSDSAQPTLGMEDLSNFSVCWPTDPSEQRRIADQVGEGRQSHAKLVRCMDRQLAVLADRRQALITAAVTGQFDVTTARPAHDHDL